MSGQKTDIYFSETFLNTSAEREIVTEELVDKGTSDFIINISGCGLVPVITILGIIGNAMSFVVFLRQRTRDRTRVILIGLAISDTCFLLTTLIRKLSCIVSMFDKTSGHNWAQLMIPQCYIIGVTFARITSVLTMVISVERCFAVLFPLKVRAIITRTRALKVVIAVFVTVIVLMFPLSLTTTTTWIVEPVSNVSIVSIRWTEFYTRNEIQMENYTNVALAILLRIMPCVVVLLCSLSVLVTLKQGQKFRKQSTTLAKSDLVTEERRITIMLLAVTTLYLVCLVPGTVLIFVKRFVPEFSYKGKYVNMFLLLSSINIVLECINSALNFVIYMKINKRFNITFKKVVCAACTEKTSRDELHMLSNGTLSSAYLD